MRLYLALGFAVFLTLVSGATAVFYFEQSGDLNYELESVSVPALEASWEAAREAERLRVLALGLMAEPGAGIQDFQTESVTDSLDRLGSALNVVGGVPSLSLDAQSVNDSANELAEVIDNLTANRDSFLAANDAAADFQSLAANISSDVGESRAALAVLQLVWLADNEADLQVLWDQFAALFDVGIDPEVAVSGRARRGLLRSRSAAGFHGKPQVPHGFIRPVERELGESLYLACWLHPKPILRITWP